MEGSLSIAGQVGIPSGEPPEQLMVFLHPAAEGEAAKLEVLEGGETSFEFRGIKPGLYRLEVQVSSDEVDYPWFYGQGDGVQAGMSDVLVLLKSVQWIEGTVLDDRRDPVGGVTVFGVGTGEATALPRKRVRTGEDGRFRLKVGQGDVVDVHAGPPRDYNPSGAIRPPDPEPEVVVSGVIAGTRDLVIRLR